MWEGVVLGGECLVNGPALAFDQALGLQLSVTFVSRPKDGPVTGVTKLNQRVQRNSQPFKLGKPNTVSLSYSVPPLSS